MRKNQLKKYPFFTLVIISSVIFGSAYIVYSNPTEKPLQVPILEYFSKGNNKHNSLLYPDTKHPDIAEETTAAPPDNDGKNEETEDCTAILPSDEACIPKTPETEAPTPTPTPAPEVPPAGTLNPPYGFVQADHSYLNGALFIGDSRTSTLYEYAGWSETDFYTSYGLTVWSVLDSKIVTQGNGNKITVDEALQKKQYPVIYIMLGINELGRGTPDSFLTQYNHVINRIRQLQPNAILFVQGIMHVTDAKDRENTYINNPEINKRNEKLKTLADNASIFYIENNEVFDSAGTGKLNPEYSFDGVHIKAKYIYIWEAFLLSHAILR